MSKSLSELIEAIDYVSARTNIMSEMLDNPDDCGIYPTTIAYQKLDAEFNKLRDIAVMLSKACEIGAFHHQACDANWYSDEVDEEKVRAGIPDPRKAKHCTCA